MSLLVATDLDRTVIFSVTAAGTALPDDAMCVEEYQGAPLSYMTARAHIDLAAAMATTRVVPVTTRTIEQYQRIRLPGPPPRYAICLNGGRVMVDGVEDRDHTAEVSARLMDAAAPFAAVYAEITGLSTVESQGPAPWVKSVRGASGVFCYVVCHSADWPLEWIDAVRSAVTRSGWTLSIQGRKIYAVPAPLTKHWALGRVASRLGDATVHAAGDSLLDEGMVLTSSSGLIPRMSELHGTRSQFPAHVRITETAGITAGEEVAAWIRRSVGV